MKIRRPDVACRIGALCLLSTGTAACNFPDYEERLCDPTVPVVGLDLAEGDTEWVGEISYTEGKTEPYALSLDEDGVPTFLRPLGFDGEPSLKGAPAFGCSDPIEFPLYEGGVNSVQTVSATAGPSWTNHARAVEATGDYLRVEYAAGDTIQLLELRLLADDRMDVRWFYGSVEFPDNFTYLHGELQRQ